MCIHNTLYHSTIFKTITDELGNTKLSINKGFKGLFSGEFFKKKSILSDDDISALQAYNTEINRGVTSQTAFYRTMQNASVEAQNMAASANGMVVNLQQIPKVSKAGQVALQALATVGNMLVFTGISMAISELINIISDCVTVSDRLQESAEQLGGEFSNTKTDIDGYKAKIEELYKTINDSSSSYSETTQARKDLMSIQDELIDKYGSEESAIKNITDAINGQSDALDKLTAKEWTDTKNKFNDSKFPDKVMNKLEGYNDKIDRMLNEYGNYTATIDLSKYGGTLFTKGYDDFKKTLIKDFGAKISDYGKEYLDLSGNADEVYKKLLSIQELLENKKVFKPNEEFSTYLGSLANDVDEVSKKYENFYNQYILYEKIFKNDNYTDIYKQITKAYTDYQNVFATGDQEAIEKAKQNFAEIVQKATSGIKNDQIVDYFNSMYPDLQAVVGSWEFEVKFKAAVKDDKDNFENEIKDAVSKFSSADDILNYKSKTATKDQVEAHTILINYAEKYKMSIEDLIALLEKLGIIASQTKNDLYNKLVPNKNNNTSGTDPNETKKWIESISDEDATLIQDNMPAFNKALEEQKQGLNGASFSAQNYQNALDNMKKSLDDAANKTDILSLENLENSIDSFKNGQTALNTALSEQNENGTITNETLSTLSDNYEDLNKVIEVTTGGIQINTTEMAKLNDENKKAIESDLDKKQKELTKAYNDGSYQLAVYKETLKDCTDKNSEEYQALSDLISKKEEDQQATLDQIGQLEALRAEYENTISTHNAFINALSSQDAGAGYDAVTNGLKQVQETWKKGDYGKDEIRTFVDYMTYADMTTASIEDIKKAYTGAMSKAKKYFTESTKGQRNFLNLLKQTKVDSNSLASVDKSGKWSINIKDIDKAAKACGVSVDFLKDNLNKLKDKGFDIKFMDKNELIDTARQIEN